MAGQTHSDFPPPGPSGSLCEVCTFSEPRYTCPCCQTRTCSLPCSRKHKQQTSCSGLRDKAKYVKMNEYGWGTMMDDFVFLEDMGRTLDQSGHETIGGRSKERGRKGHSKRDILKSQLELLDIELHLLPRGMERGKLNQSVWDSKNKVAYLTIEFMIHPSTGPSGHQQKPVTILTHKNALSTPLLDLLRLHISARDGKKKAKSLPVPEWIQGLFAAKHDDCDSFPVPRCLMKAQSSFLLARGKGAYHTLDPLLPLSTSLQHTQFIEFPTIEVWDTLAFQGVAGAQGIMVQNREDEKPPRPRSSAETEPVSLGALLDEYGSASGEDTAADSKDALDLVEMYLGSDDDE